MANSKLLLSRRGFIVASSVAAVGVPLFSGTMHRWLKASEQLSITSRNDAADKSYITAVDLSGTRKFEISVPTRCHGVAVHPRGNSQAVIFARRPGYLAFLIDFREGRVIKEFRAKEGRYFYGHGAYSLDGKYLFASENDFLGKKGLISIRDSETMNILGEIPSYGLGPHELIPIPNSNTLLIANGGVFEHPEEGGGRQKLNVDSMDPSLTYVEATSGALLGQYRTTNHHLGLRHLSLGTNGVVGVAIQSEGPADIYSPLAAFQRVGGELRIADTPQEICQRMKNFGLSLCIEGHSGVAALTCPKGDIVTFYDSNDARFIGYAALRDVSGVTLTPDRQEFLISSGVGQLCRIKISDVLIGGDQTTALVNVLKDSEIKWDNHLSHFVTV